MVSEALVTELREQGRGIVGALLVAGVSALYTVETWWAGWQLSSLHLVAYAIVGLAAVLAITRNVGFRSQKEGNGQQQSSGSEGGESNGSDGGAPSGSEGGQSSGSEGGQSSGSDSGQSRAGRSENGESGSGQGQADDGGQVTGKQASKWEFVTDFFEIVVQSFVAAYAFFLLFGVIELGEPATVVARLGLVEVVPLGFGASLANQVLTGGEGRSPSFPTHLAVVALGAVFFAAPIAPTDEVLLLAATAGWPRLGLVVVATLVLTQLTLYELEFRGQTRRLQGVDTLAQWAETAVVYAVGCAIAFGLLAMFGQLEGGTALVWVQTVIVLGFPASIGGSAARVVL